MRVLISGAGGFIGSHLMDALPDAHGFDNFLTGRRDNHAGVLELDITDRQKLYLLANEIEPDVVIHCAASYSDPDLWHRDTDTNVAGGINAALVAKHHHAHLVYFQTILPEISSYAISKLAAERYMRLSGVPLTVFRLANIYGPRNISGPIPIFYKRLSEGLPCFCVSTTRDLVYVGDVVRVVLKALQYGFTGSYDVSSGVQTPIVDMLKMVAEEMDIVPEYELRVPGEDDVQGEISIEDSLPGWFPETTLEHGIGATVDYYKEFGVTETHTHLRLADAS